MNARIMAGTQRWASQGPACDNQAAASSLRTRSGSVSRPTAQRASGDLGLGLPSPPPSGPGRAGTRLPPHGWPSPGSLGCACISHVLVSRACSPWTPALDVQGRGLRSFAVGQEPQAQRGPDQEEDRVGSRLGQRAPSVQGCMACEGGPKPGPGPQCLQPEAWPRSDREPAWEQGRGG